MLLVVAIAVSVFFITFGILVARRRRQQRAERAGYIRRAYYTDDLATVDRAIDSPAAGIIVDLMRERDVRDRAQATTEAMLRRNLELNMGLVNRTPEQGEQLVHEAVTRNMEPDPYDPSPYFPEDPVAPAVATSDPAPSSDAPSSFDGGSTDSGGGSSGEW